MSCRVSGLFHLAEGRVMREGFVLVVRVTAPVCRVGSGAGLVWFSLLSASAPRSLGSFINVEGARVAAEALADQSSLGGARAMK
jgi:hypothetical protein